MYYPSKIPFNLDRIVPGPIGTIIGMYIKTCTLHIFNFHSDSMVQKSGNLTVF